MKDLLVALHVYYHDQVDWFIDRLANIAGCQWDLVVTFSEDSHQSRRKFQAFKPDVKFMTVENVGYDVWPFIKVIKRVSLSDYAYVMKLHTKNVQPFKWKINGLRLKGERWRNILVDSLLRTPEQFSKCMDIFKEKPRTGLVCSYELCVGLSRRYPEDTYLLSEEAERIGIKSKTGRFCAGTMFIVRTECLDMIAGAHLDSSMWTSDSASHSGGTLAHVYERLFSLAVLDAGYEISTQVAYPVNYPAVFLNRNFSPVLKSVINVDRYEDGKKYLTLLGGRFPIDK
ncbi:MAG: hypothetical protein E7117_01085 [Bacteroidales bacterium]|nr:hypothetical protein [Bacteroidales bacterium]